MEKKFDTKTQIKISKTEEEEKEQNQNEKNNSYSKISNISQENEQNDNDNENDNDIEIEIDNDIFTNYNHDNELTKSQIERLNKIREEAQLRSEKYSDLSSNSNLIIKNLNKPINSNNASSIINTNISGNDSSDNINNLSNHFINNEYEENQTIELNPNLERIFNKIHPFLFLKGEPLILIGPDILYYVIIFSISSFFSIIFYSLKNQKYTIMKLLFLLGYFFYAVTYTLLLILNPGIPTNKNNIDLEELKKNYNQCNVCNCIFYKNNDYITFHCHECNICVENFDHHCTFASKCIGKNNKLIFKLWLVSIPCYIIIIFFYIII